MNISGELTMFCMGGPRFFENNVALENSPLWSKRNLTFDVHHRHVFRDCKYVHGSPLFRLHYEFPTNPSFKGHVVNDPDNWWAIQNRDEDLFEDLDDFGYIATQLTHLPKCIGYDWGNVLSYLPIYDLNISNEANYHQKRMGLTSRSVHANLLRQVKTLPFKFRTDDVAVAQRDCLNDPSVYVVNRKSLLVNKPHIFYNDDSSNVHCLPLQRNSLKWSKGFLGDCMTHLSSFRYEEPVRSVTLDADRAKISIFEDNGKYHSRPPYATYDSSESHLWEQGYGFYFHTNSKLQGKAAWYLDKMCADQDPPTLHTLKAVRSSKRIAWQSGVEGVTWNDVITHDWTNKDNLRIVMKGGQTLSLKGVLGVCHDVEPDANKVYHVATRLCSNRSAATSERMSIDNNQTTRVK